ncbi:MAG TPA: CvpA family protein [Chitinophagaceae bacterium]|nr:CvpA family protein [Chitinophagaceae bacterium]
MVIDILFVVFMLWAVFKGYSNGLIIGIFSLLSLLAGLLIALKFSAVFCHYGQMHFHLTGSWWPLVFFILIFIGVILLVNLGARLLTKLLELAMLGWLNRICGIILYMAIYTVIFSILLWLMDRVHLIPLAMKLQSRVYAYLRPVGPAVISFIGDRIPHFRHLLGELDGIFRHLARKN